MTLTCNLSEGSLSVSPHDRSYQSAVDWPTAGFAQELIAAYPEAKFILTTRSQESWAERSSYTIGRLLLEKDSFPAELQDWLGMVVRVVTKTASRRA